MQFKKNNKIFLTLLLLLFITFSFSSRLKSKSRTKFKNIISSENLRKKSKNSLFKSLNRFNLNLFRFKEGSAQKIKEGILSSEKNEVQTGSVYKKGWLKFVSYNVNEKKPLKNFFLNEAYYEQLKKPFDISTKDSYGTIDIPDNIHFFFTLTKDSLYIISARRNDIAKTQEVLHISSLSQQTAGQYIGGVEDQGEFREGFCFRLNQNLNGASEVWIICANDAGEKESWMSTIAKLKLEQQGAVSSNYYEAEAILQNSFFSNYNLNHSSYTNRENSKNGKWIILQSWSSCSLACGGGTQTLQRLCVPPENGGLPCEGKSIMIKSCNLQPCQSSVISGEEEAPAKIKMMQISKRPQTYETCIIKEGDLDQVRNDLVQFKIKPRIPVRVTMNNRTLTIFQADHYDSVSFSVALPDIKIQENTLDSNNCFDILDTRSDKSVSLCGMAYSSYKKGAKEEWVREIEFFRDKCHAPLNVEIDPIIQIKKRQIEEMEQSDKIQPELDTRKLSQLSDNLKNMQMLAFNAVSKEMKFEQMMENEEIEKEKLKDVEMQKKIEEMKEKEECLNRNLNKKKNKDQLSMKEGDLSQAINDIKDDIKNVIMKNRGKMSKKIEIMKKLADKKRRASQEEVQMIRMKIAKELFKSKKKGNLSECTPNSSQEHIDTYCNKNFHDDVDDNRDCKDSDEFCYMCCENEFGEMWGKDRDSCFKSCENRKGKGNWVWVPSGNKI